jgi:hypothetical protein
MANKKWLAISYGFIFLSVYFLFISYASIFSFVRDQFDHELPQTIAVNSTASAIGSISSWGGIALVVLLVAVVLVIIFILSGIRSMGMACGG